MHRVPTLLLAGFVGCMLAASCAAPAAAPTAPPRDANCRAPTRESVAPGTVFLHTRPPPPDIHGGNVYTGAGAVIDAHGRVLTAHHLVEHATVIEAFPVRIEEHGWAVTSSYGRRMRVVAVAPEEDAVILEPISVALPVSPLPIAESVPDEGERVHALLHYTGWKDGVVTNVDYPVPEFKALTETDVRTRGGDSGSPFVDDCGRLVGFLSKGRNDGTRSYIVPVDSALRELHFVPKN